MVHNLNLLIIFNSCKNIFYFSDMMSHEVNLLGVVCGSSLVNFNQVFYSYWFLSTHVQSLIGERLSEQSSGVI